MEAHEPSPRECCNLTILPNQCFNFSCAYCYSKKGRSSQRLDLGKIKAAIDFLLESTTAPERKFRVLYLSGGEPLMSWETVAESIEYLRKRAREKNCFRNLSVSICTNCLLQTEAIVCWLKELEVSTQISFEILEDVDALQLFSGFRFQTALSAPANRQVAERSAFRTFPLRRNQICSFSSLAL